MNSVERLFFTYDDFFLITFVARHPTYWQNRQVRDRREKLSLVSAVGDLPDGVR